jgi:hypothetical protein
MAMDFGDSAAPPDVPMSTHCINACTATHRQLQAVGYTSVKILNICMIGVNDVASEVMGLGDARVFAEWAGRNTQIMRGLSYWSLNRDNGTKVQKFASSTESGVVQAPYEFLRIFATFG